MKPSFQGFPDSSDQIPARDQGRESEFGLIWLMTLLVLLILVGLGGGLAFLWQWQQMIVARQMRLEAIQQADLARHHQEQAEKLRKQTAKYGAVIQNLDAFIAHEIADKDIPALSIALVDDQTIVWSKGFGFARPRDKTPASPDTVYRVGSVSKLFTDIGIMQLVEHGKIDLDVPITTYLPDFKPQNSSGQAITLRQMMAHHSGLVREPPVGHYFDDTNPTLARMVQSLNQTTLVYPPLAQMKYSNAAIATVGYVLERTQNQPFPRYLKKAVLDPLGLENSGFEPTPDITKQLATAYMWTYFGRQFEAPTFSLGMAPAGSMYAPVTDLGRFMSALFARGKGANGPILKPETLEKMWQPQFDKPGAKTGEGIGFFVSELEGRRKVGHNGAIYGFATELAALPDDKIGVAVVASLDGANAVTQHIANVALSQMLAVRQGKGAPTIEETKPLDPDVARKLAGRYAKDGKGLDLVERGGKLYLWSFKGGFRAEVRKLADDLILDDRLNYGTKIQARGDQIVIQDVTLERVPTPKPEASPTKWAGIIGEYGWDHNVLYILEKEGKLHALIEWFFLYPLEEVADDVFKFPEYGLYKGEKLIFSKSGNGQATQVVAASVLFKRRRIDGENGSTFKIKPLRPLDDLRKEASAAQPPKENGDFREPDLVDVASLDKTIKLDIRYATTNNFLATPFYASARAFLQRPAANALLRVHHKLKPLGYGLLIHDAYRPWQVTKMFWEATPVKERVFVADPAKGSRHNRGAAVDLTLYDLKTGKAVKMVGGYDEFSDRSYPDYIGGTTLERWQRDLLRLQMESEGFSVYEAEWWHFDYKDWRLYPILNLTFEQIAKKSPKN